MIKVIPTGPLMVNTLVIDVSKDKVLIVDPAACSYSGDETKITSYLASQKKEPLAVLLTHGHFDHVSGLPFLRKTYPDLPVLIHKEDSAFIGSNGGSLQSRQLSYMGFDSFTPAVSTLPEADGFLDNAKTLHQALSEIFTERRPELTEEEADALKKWKILHTPGHTMGGVCFYNQEDGFLVSGDTLFYGSWGRTDLGGDEGQIMKSLHYLKENIADEVLVFPGHDYTGFKMKDCF